WLASCISPKGMAYRFKHRETVPQNVKRIAAEQLDSALALLKGKHGVSREESVHEVRKSIKKTRALLRMVRPELGDFFQAENARLRDAGHELSELRDAGALVGTVNNLRRRGNGTAPNKLPGSVRSVFDQKSGVSKSRRPPENFSQVWQRSCERHGNPFGIGL